MTKSFRIAFYVRSATGNLADLKRQVKILDQQVIDRRIDHESCSVEIYLDAHQSGLRPGPELERLLRDVKQGLIDVVMVSRMNRISRSLSGLIQFYQLVETEAIRFISSAENVDSTTWHSSHPPTKAEPITLKGICLSKTLGDAHV